MSTGEVNQIMQRLAAIEVKLDLAIDDKLADHERRLRRIEQAPLALIVLVVAVILQRFLL